MQVEYTGRQVEITRELRAQAEEALARVGKLLGSSFTAHVVLSCERYRQVAEVTVTVRAQTIVGAAEAADPSAALRDAMDKVERQALRWRERWRTKRRQPKQEKSVALDAHPPRAERSGRGAREQARGVAEPVEQESATLAVGVGGTQAVHMVAHSFPARVRVSEAHIVRSDEALASRSMSLEEAIKEAEFRDRELLVFRDPEGRLKILHRRKDGKLELVEIP